MYDYGYGYGTPSYDTGATLLGGLFASLGLIMLLSSALGILMIISQWKIYKKAGKKGWECLIPIYNIIVLIEIVGLPTWYIALFLVPFANIYAMFKIFIELAHKFGKTTGFGVLTAFFSPICLPILAFGKNNVYEGTTNQNAGTNNMVPPMNDMNNQYNQMNTMNTNMNNFQNPGEPVMFNPTMNTNINPMPISPVVEQQETFVNPATTIPTPVEPVIPTPIVNPEPTVNFNQPTMNVTEPVIPQPITNPVPETNLNQNMGEVNQVPGSVPTTNEPQAISQDQMVNNPINNFNQNNNQNM